MTAVHTDKACVAFSHRAACFWLIAFVWLKRWRFLLSWFCGWWLLLWLRAGGYFQPFFANTETPDAKDAFLWKRTSREVGTLRHMIIAALSCCIFFFFCRRWILVIRESSCHTYSSNPHLYPCQNFFLSPGIHTAHAKLGRVGVSLSVSIAL